MSFTEANVRQALITKIRARKKYNPGNYTIKANEWVFNNFTCDQDQQGQQGKEASSNQDITIDLSDYKEWEYPDTYRNYLQKKIDKPSMFHCR